jgi:hypothetical protein
MPIPITNKGSFYVDSFLESHLGKSDASIVNDRTVSTAKIAAIIALTKKPRVKPQNKPARK